MRGTTRCDLHGGKSPQAQLAVARRDEEARARSLLERLGEPEPLGHPVEELLAIAEEARAWLVVLRERVDELHQLETVDRVGVERERALVGLYERALDRTAKMLADLIRLDLDARLVRVSETQAAMLETVITHVLTQPELALSRGQQDLARYHVSRELRALSARGAD